jgi:hypothetical protein
MIHEVHIRTAPHRAWKVWAEHTSDAYAADDLQSLRARRPLYAWRVVTYYPADL